ncbi:hypothetical protein BKA61DRAFT_574749 [Leptodontidium sp. MPI-SDFR-AT-0119]|nr:hypothetical protein BKA61DRAFT_574749 [Leptodontidium sp. MPI-SDFR-AT-0119]
MVSDGLLCPGHGHGYRSYFAALKGVWLYDKNGKKIQSGDYFELQTEDLMTKPLLSFELLELQWFLQRIQGMVGAADVEADVEWDYRLDGDSDSDNAIEEIPSLDLDNDVEDFSLLSEESIYSPVKPSSYPLYPKQATAEVEGDGDREGGRDLVL